MGKITSQNSQLQRPGEHCTITDPPTEKHINKILEQNILALRRFISVQQRFLQDKIQRIPDHLAQPLVCHNPIKQPLCPDMVARLRQLEDLSPECSRGHASVEIHGGYLVLVVKLLPGGK